ncbi:MAG: acyl carrier protein [Fibrobacter sp.]|nr:acyl carrier protein [Fibrobacter sp.]
MTKEEVSQKVIAHIARLLGMNQHEVTPESLVVADLGADSLDLVEIVMAVEDELEIEILDSEMAMLSTVQDWINLAAEKVGAQNKD